MGLGTLNTAPSALAIAWLAIRPRTLGISVAPVLVGSSLAWASGYPPQWLTFFATLCCAMLIQIATNLHNDAIDAEKGNDQADRPGPLRVTSAGWVTANNMKRCALASFSLAFLLGIYLASLGGWPVIAIGLTSLAAGWAYSGGPKPISYSPFGELFVLIFFGLLAVIGTAWLQGLPPDLNAILSGIVCGLPAAAVLLVNNTRDLEADTRVGRRTLASVLGTAKAGHVYRLLLLIPFLLISSFAWQGHRLALLGLLALPSAWQNIQHFFRAKHPIELGPLLPSTARTGLMLASLLTLSYLLESLALS